MKVYQDYVRSKWWRQLTNSLRSRGVRCFGCNTRKRLQFHHTSYQRLYDERANDVIPLCRACHERLHTSLKERYPSKSVTASASKTAIVYKLLFGMELGDKIAEFNWERVFESAYRSTVAVTGSCKKSPRKRARRRSKMLRDMHRDKLFHEKMCGH